LHRYLILPRWDIKNMKLPIYLIESKSRQDLAQTFMRFQEYYESPEFAGKYFTTEDFLAWYGQKYRKSVYHKDWSGFNVPSNVFNPFFEGNFDPLTDKEKKLLNFLKGVDGEFYVIGITKADYDWVETLKHELAHGMFFSDKSYREEILACISELSPNSARMSLKKMGYGSNVIDDEVNAYLLTEPETMANPHLLSLSNSKSIQEKLNRVFEKHFAFSMIGAGNADLVKNLVEVVI